MSDIEGETADCVYQSQLCFVHFAMDVLNSVHWQQQENEFQWFSGSQTLVY